MKTSTIAAIATPAGSGGIGIIKISGPKAPAIAASIFRRPVSMSGSDKNLIHLSRPVSHLLYYGYIVDMEGCILDEVLLVLMKSPRTYTREDLVEIHAHSGTAVLRSILNLVLQQGARLAEPGEFTRRAFLNGRIDLTQAEGVIDIINAKTGKALEIAAAQIMGGMKKRIESIRNALLQILAETEAAIDFPDDVGDGLNMDKALDIIQNSVAEPMKKLLQEYEDAHILREGLKVIVAGRPNVGKSSLMNRLLERERAIVTSIPGTTRDIIEESLNIQGISIILTDTAGLHDTDDPVEKIGIERAYEHIKNADLVLFMTDAGSPLSDADFAIYKAIAHKPLIWVINKCDMLQEKDFPSIPEEFKDIPKIQISAKYDPEMDRLKNLISDIAMKESMECESMVIPNLRHKQAVEKSLEAVYAAIKGINEGIPFELVNIDIQEAAGLLGEVIGITIKEDIMDQIFSRFCIGK